MPPPTLGLPSPPHSTAPNDKFRRCATQTWLLPTTLDLLPHPPPILRVVERAEVGVVPLLHLARRLVVVPLGEDALAGRRHEAARILHVGRRVRRRGRRDGRGARRGAAAPPIVDLESQLIVSCSCQHAATSTSLNFFLSSETMLTARTPECGDRAGCWWVGRVILDADRVDVEFGKAAECCGKSAARDVADDGDGERLCRCAAEGVSEAREVAAGAGGGLGELGGLSVTRVLIANLQQSALRLATE